MTGDLKQKYESLKNYIKRLGGVAIAFSGGVDSSLLAKVGYDVLGDKALAVTIASPIMAPWDMEDAKSIAAGIGIKHIFIKKEDIPSIVRQNSADRCYFCKKEWFRLIIKTAKDEGCDVVMDGSNADDLKDYRPGLRAVKELNVISPLKAIGFNKSEIRELSKFLGLATWCKPAYACLASRIPYGEEITLQKLKNIEKAETYLHLLGYPEVRIRHHNEIARIELNPSDRVRFCNPETMDKVSRQLKEYGFVYICLELEGYSMGSLNRTLQ